MAWIMRDGTIINTDNTIWIDKALTAPYPANIWRIDSLTNEGKPYHLLLPGVASINLTAQPQKPLIHVYDARTHNPSDYDGNGYAIIHPISGKVRHEKNGLYNAELETYIDDSGAFKYLESNAVLKIPLKYHDKWTQQLFRINNTVRKMDKSGAYRISVTAPHIFYDLNGKLLMSCTVGEMVRPMGDINGDGIVDDKDYALANQEYMAIQTGKESTLTDEQMLYADMNGDGVVDMSDVSAISAAYTDEPTYKAVTGNTALNQLFNAVFVGFGDNDIIFGHSSDITDKAYTETYTGISLTAALLGSDNAFVNRLGGVLYRDNFRFSINKNMEGYRETGVIRYGYNLTEIEFTVDTSECFTYLIAEDNYGNRIIVKNDEVPCKKHPHHIFRYVKMSYNRESHQRLQEDAQTYYDNYKDGNINIKVKIANIANKPEYEEFLQLADYEVGDKVIVYHKDLDVHYSNLEIIAKTYDIVDQSTIEIEIGTFKNAIVRSAFMSGTASSGQSAADKQMAAMQGQLNQNTAKNLMYWDNLEAYTWDELEQYTWDMLEGYY